MYHFVVYNTDGIIVNHGMVSSEANIDIQADATNDKGECIHPNCNCMEAKVEDEEYYTVDCTDIDVKKHKLKRKDQIEIDEIDAYRHKQKLRRPIAQAEHEAMFGMIAVTNLKKEVSNLKNEVKKFKEANNASKAT